jgi:hypothetical protein
MHVVILTTLSSATVRIGLDFNKITVTVLIMKCSPNQKYREQKSEIILAHLFLFLQNRNIFGSATLLIFLLFMFSK